MALVILLGERVHGDKGDQRQYIAHDGQQNHALGDRLTEAGFVQIVVIVGQAIGVLHQYGVGQVGDAHADKGADKGDKLRHQPLQPLAGFVLLVVQHIGVHGAVGDQRKGGKEPSQPGKGKQHPDLLDKEEHTDHAHRGAQDIDDKEIALAHLADQQRRQQHSRGGCRTQNGGQGAVEHALLLGA